MTSVKLGRCRRIPESEVERLIVEGATYAQGQAPVKPLAAASARLHAMARAQRSARP